MAYLCLDIPALICRKSHGEPLLCLIHTGSTLTLGKFFNGIEEHIRSGNMEITRVRMTYDHKNLVIRSYLNQPLNLTVSLQADNEPPQESEQSLG